jgi:hypothetical protein
MDMVRLHHLHVVLRELVHDVGQILVDGREDGYADGEVRSPEEGLLAVFGAQAADVVAVVFHPACGTAHHLHVDGLEGPEVIAVGSHGRR